MITDIPSAADFREAAISTLHLAWRIAIDADKDLYWELEAKRHEGDVFVGDVAPPLSQADVEAVRRRHLERSQVSLGNALSLAQQSAEFALKARIAEVSPFLLIVRDPRDLPRKSATRDVAYSEFRSIDATDLVRVHDTVRAASDRLPPEFSGLWDELRRRRNALMHTVAPGQTNATTEYVLEAVLQVHCHLLPGTSWPRRRVSSHFEYENEGRHPIQRSLEDVAHPVAQVMAEIQVALTYVSDEVALATLGFDRFVKHYLCPWCSTVAADGYFDETDEGTPMLATSAETAESVSVKCLVCERSYPAERRQCPQDGCDGDLLSLYQGTEAMCLRCGVYADDRG